MLRTPTPFAATHCGEAGGENEGLTMTTVREQLAEDPWLAAIVESSDDAIITKDLGGVTTSWNGAAERLFGYRAAQVIGQPIIVMFPPNRGEEEFSVMERIGRGELVNRYETDRCH